MGSRSSFILTDPYEPDGRGGGKLIQFPNRKDDDMTTEELDLKIDQLAYRVNDLAEVVSSLGEVVKADRVVNDAALEGHRVKMEARCNGTDAAIDALQSQGHDANKKAKEMAVTVAGAAEALKRIEEMRGDVALCKSGIRDLDAIRDSFVQSAKGFSERIDRVEESVAAIQTLRHREGSPRSDG